MTASDSPNLDPTSPATPEPAPAPVVPRTLGVTNTLLLLVASAVLLFAFLGFHSTLTEHEVYAAQPAREMLDGGSLVLQPFAGAYRVKKPPGQSWLIATSLAFTGVRNEYTARLPSAVAGTLAALIVGSLGAAFAGRRVGLIAGLMTLTCYAVQVRARLAEADMALALCALTANAIVLRRLLAVSVDATVTGGGWRPFAYWLLVAAGFLIKGPIILLFTVLPAAVLLPLIRRDGSAFALVRRTVFNPYAVGLFVLIVGGWILSALAAHPQALATWWGELRRERETGRDPVWSYAGFVPMALLPWTPFALAGLGRWRLSEPARLMLFLWAFVGGAAISLVAFKRMHYALPLLPPLVLICARGFDALLFRFVAGKPAAGRRGGQLIFAWFGIATVGWLLNQIVLEPRDVGDRAVKVFSTQVNESVPASEPIYLVGVGEERTAWYLDRRLVQTRLLEDDSIQTQLSRLPTDRLVYVLCRVPSIAPISEKMSVIRLLTSEDYRGKGEDQERRALLRVRAIQPATMSSTSPATMPVTEATP